MKMSDLKTADGVVITEHEGPLYRVHERSSEISMIDPCIVTRWHREKYELEVELRHCDYKLDLAEIYAYKHNAIKKIAQRYLDRAYALMREAAEQAADNGKAPTEATS